MAYNQLTNPPFLLTSGGIDGGGSIWRYASTDPIATVEGAGYFSDGGQRGMKLDDIVFVFDTNLGRMYPCFVSAVTAPQNNNSLLSGFNPPGAATISPGQFS